LVLIAGSDNKKNWRFNKTHFFEFFYEVNLPDLDHCCAQLSSNNNNNIDRDQITRKEDLELAYLKVYMPIIPGGNSIKNWD